MSWLQHLLPLVEVRDTAPNKKRKQTSHRGLGPKVPHTTVPAEHVLDMRYRYEVLREPALKIVRAYPQYSETYVRHVLDYVVRANLRVTPIIKE